MDYMSFDKKPDFSDAKYSIRDKKQRPRHHYQPGKPRLVNLPITFNFPAFTISPVHSNLATYFTDISPTHWHDSGVD